MANGQGGAHRARKKRRWRTNLADGNPGKRKLTVLDFTDSAADLEGGPYRRPERFLAAKQKNGKDLLAMEVYEETWKWLAERNCAQLIPRRSWSSTQWPSPLDSMRRVHHRVRLSCQASHDGQRHSSPYVAMSQSFSKQANNLWYQIYQVVRENCAVEYRGATPRRHDGACSPQGAEGAIPVESKYIIQNIPLTEIHRRAQPAQERGNPRL